MAVRKRIGVMMPTTNTTVEPDFNRIAPPDVTIHAQHLWISSFREGPDAIREAMDEMNSQLEQGAWYLAQGKVEIVSMVGTTNSFYRDRAWSNEMEQLMSRASGGLPAVATSPSVVQALNHFGAKKISVATPYPDWSNERLKLYFDSAGFDVLNVEGEPWAAQAGPQGMNDQDPELIVEFASKVCREDADALFCACTGWRAMEAAAELEQRLGKPVVTSVQATAWRTFRKVGITQSISGSGSLLEQMPPVAD